MDKIKQKGKQQKSFFAKTQDEKTAKQLEEYGFQLINYDGTTWVFDNTSTELSNDKAIFEKGKIAYSNILCI